MSEALSHGEFVAAYRAGSGRLRVDRTRAARFIAGRMLLPFVLLPVLGGAVALALLGHWLIGAAAFALALAARYLVRASSQGYVLWRALDDPQFYREALAAGIITIAKPDDA